MPAALKPGLLGGRVQTLRWERAGSAQCLQGLEPPGRSETNLRPADAELEDRIERADQVDLSGDVRASQPEVSRRLRQPVDRLGAAEHDPRRGGFRPERAPVPELDPDRDGV